MMFSQMAWEKMADQIWAYREEYRQHNQGEEAPPIHIADFVACHADQKKAEEIAHRHIVGYYWSVRVACCCSASPSQFSLVS
jgi:hypothetical protein